MRMSEPDRPVSSDCAAMSDILSRIGDKWSVMVVGKLRDGPVRFNTIKREIGGISQRMLTLTLRNLERDGLVIRTFYPEIPPRVEYSLTPLGQTLLPAIGSLWDWSVVHHADVVEAREDYDTRDGRARIAAE
jgi:DNA-binding HxlR family transcriptional regulator